MLAFTNLDCRKHKEKLIHLNECKMKAWTQATTTALAGVGSLIYQY